MKATISLKRSLNSHDFYMKYLKLTSIFLLFFTVSWNLEATHNRAGEITYRQTGDLTIEATITTYTKASSIPADRDSLQICWGDNLCEMVARSNGDGETLPNDTKKNLYIASHTYSGQDRYTISMTDPNRNADILNVNPPGSDNVQFHLQTTVSFFNPLFDGYNSSPILLQPPIDIGCVGQPFIHNPNAFEPDGDSLAYHLTIPLQDVDAPVPNYSFPNQISADPSTIQLNEITGDFEWISPQLPGEYNIAMYIIEYRNGVAIDTLIRDMQILIEDCDNLPPEIETIDEICVVAGELLEFDVIATDPDEPLQQVELTALGGPFILSPSPADFTVPTGLQPQPVEGKFSWQTTCEHISDNFYSVVFKAVDSGVTPLFTLKTVRIKVVGPPPLDLQAEPNSGSVELSWENPYVCIDAEEEYFWDFSVWRREGSNLFEIDTCVTGLEGKGYTKIEFEQTIEIVNNRYYYQDDDVERGTTYCYRILAEFAKRTAINQAFNKVESLPSDEICVQLSRDIPLMTNVDVEITDNGSGEIFVQWSKPLAVDLDTTINLPPYRYELLRATGITDTGFEVIQAASSTSNTFWEANDTSFIDTGLNTVDNAYTYQVAFYVNNEPEPIDFSPGASSTFLSVASTDNTNTLTWEHDVSWNNYIYNIYIRNNNTGVFNLVDSTTQQTYVDNNLLNDVEYCYYVECVGTYNIPNILDPLFNKSQQACGIPLDTVPPCPPTLTVSNICDSANSSTPEDAFENDLTWTNPILWCAETDDVVGYNIFYAPIMGANFEQIFSYDNPFDTTHVHQPEIGIAGCYVVTALDTLGNESEFSNVVCVDNCPLYELPNVFTPNGDGANDLFIPFTSRFVDRIEMQIFNRWGGLVHETNDPMINWDGKNLKGNDLAEGVYYYTCKVFETRVNGVVENSDILSGFIQLIRSK